MATTAALLKVMVSADTAKATTALRRFDSSVSRTGTTSKAATTHASRLDKATNKLGSSLGRAARYAAGAAVAYLSVAQAKAAVSTTQELANTSLVLSRNLGLSTKQASRWASVAKTRDISTKQMNASFTTLTQRLTDARAGSDEAMESFKALGVTQKDLQTDGDNFNKTLLRVSEALGDAEGGAKRQDAAVSLLGRGYQNLLPIMGQGSEALREQLRLGDQYGSTMGKTAVDAQTRLTATLRESERAWQGLQVTFTEAITPALKNVNKEFQHLSEIMANDKLTNADKFKKVGAVIGKWADEALDGFIAVLPKIVEHAAETAPKIAGAFVKGFLNAPILGQLVLGGWLFRGLLGKMGGVGTKLGTTLGTSLGGAAGPIAAGMVISAIAGAWAGHKLAKTMNISDAATKMADDFDIPLKKAQLVVAYMRHHPGLGVVEALEAMRDAPKSAALRIEKDADYIRKAFKHGFSLKETAGQFKSELGVIVANYGKGTAETKQLSQTAYAAMTAHVSKMVKSGKINLEQAGRFLGQFGGSVKDLGAEFRPMSNKAVTAFHEVETNAERMKNQAAGNFASFSDKARTALHDVASTAKDKGKELETAVVGSVNSMVGGASKGFGRLGAMTNKALKAFGVKPVAFAIAEGIDSQKKQRGGVIRAARGRLVPGRGSGDKVPAMLEPGEVVINRRAVAAMGGARRVNAVNRKIPRFAAGGVAQPPGDPGTEVVQAGYEGAVGSFLKRFGMNLTQGYNPSGPSVSAGHLQLGVPPSLDVVPLNGDWDGPFAQGLRWALGQGMQVGYDGQYGTQSWDNHGEGNHAHIDWLASAGKVGGAALEKISRVLLEGPDGPLKSMGQSALDKVRAAANKYVSSQAPPGVGEGAEGSFGPAANVGSLPKSLQKWNKQYPYDSTATMPSGAVQALAAWQGLPDWFYKIAIGESAFQPGAVGHDPGGTTGYGLYQETDPYANSYVKAVTGGLDYNNMLNPVLNTMAAKLHYSAAPSQTPNTPGFPWYGTSGLQEGGIVQGFAGGGIVGSAGGSIAKGFSLGAKGFGGGGIVASYQRARRRGSGKNRHYTPGPWQNIGGGGGSGGGGKSPNWTQILDQPLIKGPPSGSGSGSEPDDSAFWEAAEAQAAATQALAEAMNALTAEMGASNALVNSVGSIDSYQALKAFADLMSGELGGRLEARSHTAAYGSVGRS